MNPQGFSNQYLVCSIHYYYYKVRLPLFRPLHMIVMHKIVARK